MNELDLQAKIQEYAALPPLEYQAKRKSLAKELGIRASVLDAEIEKISSRVGRGGKPFENSNGSGSSRTGTGTSRCSNDRSNGGDRSNGVELFEQARPLIEADDPLELVRKALIAGGYAGDTAPGELTYVSVSSRHLARPLNLHLQGPSGSGKNHAVDAGVELHPPEAYYKLSASSPRALVYTNENFEHRVVVLQEMDSIPDEGPAASAVRAIANDARMTYEVVEQNPKTKQYGTRKIEKEGPTGLITTGIQPLDAQMATRCLTVCIPDDEKQTRAVIGAEARAAEGHQNGKIDYELFHAYQCWLTIGGEHRVLVPFASALAKIVPVTAVRIRRDFKQLLTTIQTFALLSQFKRPKNEEGKILATINEDYARARRLLAPLLDSVVNDGLTPAIRTTVEAVEEGEEFSEAELARHLKMSKAGVAYRVRHAIVGGWLKNSETRRGYPARLSRAAPLPDQLSALPPPADLAEVFESEKTAEPSRGQGLEEGAFEHSPPSYSHSNGAESPRGEGVGAQVFERSNDLPPSSPQEGFSDGADVTKTLPAAGGSTNRDKTSRTGRRGRTEI